MEWKSVQFSNPQGRHLGAHVYIYNIGKPTHDSQSNPMLREYSLSLSPFLRLGLRIPNTFFGPICPLLQTHFTPLFTFTPSPSPLLLSGFHILIRKESLPSPWSEHKGFSAWHKKIDDFFIIESRRERERERAL